MESATLLALVAGVLWGIEPIVAKRGMASGGSSLQASVIVVAVDSALFWTILAASQGTDAFVGISVAAAALFLLAGILGTALGRIAIFVGVDRVGASVNSALVSTRPFFAGALAVLFLGESVTASTVAGIVVLVTGVAIIALSRSGDIGGWQAYELLIPLGGALAFGASNVVRKFGLDSFPEILVLQAVALNEFGALVALTAYALATGRRDVVHAPGRTYVYFAACGLFTGVALLGLYTALRLGRVVVVDPLVSTAPLFTAVFAAVFLRDLERVTVRFVVGVVLTVTGIVLIVVPPSLVF